MLFFELFSLNLSRLFHCSVIKVLAAFCCRFLLTAVCVSSFIISCVQVFVNNFFNFSNKLFSNCLWICTVSRCSRWQLIYNITSSIICQQLFYNNQLSYEPLFYNNQLFIMSNVKRLIFFHFEKENQPHAVRLCIIL